MLFASDISKVYSNRTLFSGLTLSVAAGDRIALVGPNGSGPRSGGCSVFWHRLAWRSAKDNGP